jgi:release factor glutamine methyltransferase
MSLKKNGPQHAVIVFEKMRSETSPYTITMLGKRIPLLPNVFSPKYVTDVKWFAKHIPTIVKKRSFLEIGTGSGVIALFVSLNGASKVVATDINPDAVRNARQTFRLHNVPASTRCGDVFKPIKKNEKFDVIFWNHPFFSTVKPRDMLARGAFDYKYKSLRAFFHDAKRHLSKGGEVLLGTGKAARISEIKKIAQTNGYTCTLIKKETIPSKHRKGIVMDARIYSFKPVRRTK